MAESKLKIDMRRNDVMEHLRKQGQISVSQLSKLLNVTPVTLRNDLTALEKEGYLHRTRGGAVLIPRSQNNHLPVGDPQDHLRKQLLAAQVATFIQDGQTLFFNSGTTTAHIAQALRGKKHLHIVTNSVAVAMELGSVPTFHVLLLGGDIDARYGFTHGGDAQDQLSKYRADWAILSVDGVSAQGGITTYHPEEAIIDRLMITNAKQCMIAAVGSKIGNMGFSRISDCGPRLHLITELGCDESALTALNEQGVRITRI